MRQHQEAGLPIDNLLVAANDIETRGRENGLDSAVRAALLLSADIHLDTERYDDAIEAARRAFEVPRNRVDDLNVGLWALDRMISAHVARRDDAAISATAGQAIELIERHRYNINAPYAQSAYLQDRTRYYTIGIASAFRCDDLDTVLQRADQSKAGASVRSLARSPEHVDVHELQAEFRTVSLELQQAEIAGESETADALADRRRVLWELMSIARARPRGSRSLDKPVTVNAVIKSLASDESLVYYYWLQPTVLLIAAFDSQRVRIVKKVIDESVRRRLEEYATFVQSLLGMHGYLDTIGRFSHVLLPEEIRPVIDGKRRLLFSPHQLLHALPLHALRLGGDYLIRKFAVSYVPNLACALRSLRPANTQRVLAIGVRDFTVPGKPLRPLEASEAEAQNVARAYQDRGASASTLLGTSATLEEVRRLATDGALHDLSCLHLATHGDNVLGDYPMEARLYLRDGDVDGLEISSWSLTAELVVLSACHSGQRAITLRGASELGGDELFGLQAAFFTAGATRVLGALWPAESPVAARLMSRFHTLRADGMDADIALQTATLEHVDGAPRLMQKLYYWAPFYISVVARAQNNGTGELFPCLS